MEKRVIIFLLGMILANLLFLDFQEAGKNKEVNPAELFTSSITPTIEITSTPNNFCPNACLDKINEATASIKLEKPIVTVAQQVKTRLDVKEFFVPIGAGTNSSGEWEDVPGLQVTIDSNQYGNIKSAVFEATVRVPTLDEWVKVRLFNLTDNRAVSSSEVSFTIGSPPTLLVSSPITLDSGIKTYKVQMKTQIRHPSYLDQSRIHITTY